MREPCKTCGTVGGFGTVRNIGETARPCPECGFGDHGVTATNARVAFQRTIVGKYGNKASFPVSSMGFVAYVGKFAIELSGYQIWEISQRSDGQILATGHSIELALQSLRVALEHRYLEMAKDFGDVIWPGSQLRITIDREDAKPGHQRTGPCPRCGTPTPLRIPDGAIQACRRCQLVSLLEQSLFRCRRCHKAFSSMEALNAHDRDKHGPSDLRSKS